VESNFNRLDRASSVRRVVEEEEEEEEKVKTEE